METENASIENYEINITLNSIGVYVHMAPSFEGTYEGDMHLDPVTNQPIYYRSQ
jgi:hypothetical protein